MKALNYWMMTKMAANKIKKSGLEGDNDNIDFINIYDE